MRTAVRASAALRTVPVRHKFQHIVKYGQVGSTDRQRVPTLRQLLTHLQEKEHPILTARKAMERGKRKVLRKPKRLTNDVFYDSKHLVAMDEFRAEIAAVMQKDTSQAQVILEDQQRVLTVKFEERVKEQQKPAPSEEKLARRALRREKLAARKKAQEDKEADMDE